MYGEQTYLTATDLVSSWGPTNYGTDNAGSDDGNTFGTDGNGYAGAAVTWTASTATANALIYSTSDVGFTTAEALALTAANTAVDLAGNSAMYSIETTLLF